MKGYFLNEPRCELSTDMSLDFTNITINVLNPFKQLIKKSKQDIR